MRSKTQGKVYGPLRSGLSKELLGQKKMSRSSVTKLIRSLNLISSGPGLVLAVILVQVVESVWSPYAV